MSQVFHQKLKIKTTKVSKKDFLLVDMDMPNLTKNNLGSLATRKVFIRLVIDCLSFEKGNS